jgi:hypothetical protein
MMEKYHVEIHTGTALTAQQAADLHPDQVIVASGANDFIPPIKGHGCLLPPGHKNSGCA